MTGDDDIDKDQNDQPKVLMKDLNHPVQTNRVNMYPEVSCEVKHGDTELCEKRQPSIVDNETNTTDPQNPSAEVSKPNLLPAVPKRFIILIFITLANFNMYCIRMCLNVTIVAMTHGEGKKYNSTGPHLSKDAEPEFHWDKQFQGSTACFLRGMINHNVMRTILASLFWGYTTLQLPAGLLTVKYGGSSLLSIAILGSSVLTFLTPFVVRRNVYAFLFLRIMEGSFLGLVPASAVSLISKWSPIYERSIFLMVGHSGVLWGNVFANSLSGVLSGCSWGWSSVFYYFGVQGILWCLFWSCLSYEEPSNHPNITKAELELIGKHWNTKLLLSDVPWKYMLTSTRVWAIIVPYFTSCWTFYSFMLSLPTYLKDVQNLDIVTIGLASSLPYVSAGVASPTWGYFIDVLRSKKFITTTNARKLSSFIGAGVSGIFVVAMVHASTPTSAIAIVTMAITLGNLNTSGPSTNVIELAPKYSGILMGIANLSCNLSGFIAPEVVGALTVHGNDIRHQWAIVFYMTAGINALGMTFYLCFASAKKQDWADY